MNQRNMNNPFVLGGVARGSHFAGRTREVARLRTLAREGQRLFLFAPRRYGKTSLIREALEPEADAGRLLLFWCDCLATSDEHSLTRRIAEPVIRAARHKGVKQWAKAAAGLFKRIRPTLAIGHDGEVRVSVDLAASGAAGPDDIEDALGAAGRLAASRKQPAIFVFDEFQQIAAWDRNHQTEAAIRTVVQDQPGIAYVFAGSEQHLLEAMFATRDRPLFKLAVPFPLDRLADDELRPWLSARFSETGFALDPDALEALLQLGAGHPWATQYLAHFVWSEAAARRVAHITIDSIHHGLAAALHVGATIYDRDLATVTPSQRRVLVALAAESTSSPVAASYLREHRLPAKSTVSQALRSLVQHGFAERKDGWYRLSDPLFGEWLRKQ